MTTAVPEDAITMCQYRQFFAEETRVIGQDDNDDNSEAVEKGR